ncbi:MAG: autotransporter domain-containing protein [Rickettsiales bacterium]|nr:autotransporter domain-containing protein [Rickettsiales bacterium]
MQKIYITILMCATAMPALADNLTAPISIAAGTSESFTTADISGQTSTTHGVPAAIMINPAGSVSIGDNAIISNNTGTSMGAAINNASGTVSFGDNARFMNNAADESNSIGGFLYNSNNASFTVGNNALFSGNTSTAIGGAIYQQVQGAAQTATLNIGNGAEFSNNSSVSAGAIYNLNYGTSIINIGENSLFYGNRATGASGGAIGNWWSEFNIADGANFIANSAATNGGAIITEGEFTFLGSSYFMNNSAAQSGGAIANMTMYDDYGYAFLDFNGAAVFTGNSAGADGGAIHNETVISFADGAKFYGNSAGTNGGAVSSLFVSYSPYNETQDGDITVNFSGESIFENNSAGGLGGAIYNGSSASMNFSGSAYFSKNSANGVANDIYNEGVISFADNSIVSLDGGITGTGTLNFGQNTLLSVKLSGTPAITADTISIGAGSVISNIKISNGLIGDNIALVSGNTVSGGFVLGENAFSNALYNISQNNDYTFNITKNSIAQMAQATGASVATATAMNAIVSGGSANNAQFSLLQTKIADLLQSDSPADVSEALAAVAATNPTTAPSVQSSSAGNVSQVFSAAGARVDGDAGGGPAGMSSGDYAWGDWTLWVMGMADSAKFTGDSAFNSNSTGMTIGIEQEHNKAKIGFGYSYSETKVSATNRTDNIRSSSLLAYGGYKISDWYMHAMTSYSFSNYNENKNVLGANINGTYQANAAAVQLTTGYAIPIAETSKLSPEIGARYINVAQSDMTDSAGNLTQTDSLNIATAIGALKLSSVSEGDGFKAKFQLRLGMTYDFVNSDVNSAFTLANGETYSVAGSAMPRLGTEFGMGVSLISAGGFSCGLEYRGAIRHNYADNSGILTAKYQF